jgi:tetratricopeptide (TPR) repeat protein
MSPRRQGANALARGEKARREHRLSDAEDAFREAVRCFRELGQRAELAYALTRRAQIERDIGDYDSALRDQGEALALCRDLPDKLKLAHTIRHMADILQDAGRHLEAAPYFKEVLQLYRARDDVDPLEMANAIRSVAIHAEHMGEADEARQLWLEARNRYGALDERFALLTGSETNPGVHEADDNLARLAQIAE